MTRSVRRYIVVALLLAVAGGGIVFAQRGGFGGRSRGGFGRGSRIQSDLDSVPRPADMPNWDVDPQFKKDAFTFVRVRYNSPYRQNAWFTDYPDSDYNFSFRLQQLTSLKVNPNPVLLDLTDERILNYPFLYMLEVGELEFTEPEIENLRRYCANGGFVMVDDHWGVAEYENFHQQILRAFPGREPVELPITHPIFHCVFDLKEPPQVPGINVAQAYRGTGIIWERPDAKGAHYRAVFDDKGRIMVLICSNTDLGDGWEREGEDAWYFHEFSEKKAYPMGINIVFYAMTH